MRELELLQVNMSILYHFGYCLPVIPSPVLPSFTVLVNALRPYGVSASDISIRPASQRLSDAGLIVSFFGGRVVMSLGFENYELLINDTQNGDLERISTINGTIFNALKELFVENPASFAKINWKANLGLNKGEVENFLQSHFVPIEGSNINFQPNALAYQLKWDKPSAIKTSALLITKSEQFVDSLYFDLSVAYAIKGTPVGLHYRFMEDLWNVMNVLELKIGGEAEEETESPETDIEKKETEESQ